MEIIFFYCQLSIRLHQLGCYFTADVVFKNASEKQDTVEVRTQDLQEHKEGQIKFCPRVGSNPLEQVCREILFYTQIT